MGGDISIPRIEIMLAANENQEIRHQLVEESEIWLRSRLSTRHVEGGLSKPGVWAIHFHGPVIQQHSDHNDAILKSLITSIKSLFDDVHGHQTMERIHVGITPKPELLK